MYDKYTPVFQKYLSIVRDLSSIIHYTSANDITHGSGPVTANIWIIERSAKRLLLFLLGNNIQNSHYMTSNHYVTCYCFFFHHWIQSLDVYSVRLTKTALKYSIRRFWQSPWPCFSCSNHRINFVFRNKLHWKSIWKTEAVISYLQYVGNVMLKKGDYSKCESKKTN